VLVAGGVLTTWGAPVDVAACEGAPAEVAALLVDVPADAPVDVPDEVGELSLLLADADVPEPPPPPPHADSM
jgi:hypothetical protein